jgi:hypothetical protein
VVHWYVSSRIAEDIILAIFQVPPKQIQNLKAEERNISFHCSTIVFAFAYHGFASFEQIKDIDNKNLSFHLVQISEIDYSPQFQKSTLGIVSDLVLLFSIPHDLIKEEGFALAAACRGNQNGH